MENKKVTLTGILSLRSKGKGLQVHGFTLVELIVVITILAILGTIAFISLQGYSKDARDSVRISDISKIKTSLELFQLDAGKYPDTTEATNITYSGAIAWTQGTFGEATFNNVTKLDKIPTDPVTDRKYVYSVTNTKQEYQIAGIMEGDEVTINTNQPHPSPLLRGEGIDGILETNAAQKTALLKISGNYNGKVLKVSTGGTDYVLAIPSIITSSGFTVDEIVANNYLAYNGYKNLPAQYAGSLYEILGDEEINLVNSDDLVIYSGDLKTLSSSEQVGIDARKNLIENFKNAYSGTAITGIGEIAQIINTDTENETATEFLGATIVSNNLGGSIAISSGGGSKIAPIVQWKDIPGTNCTNEDYVFTLTGVTYTWAGCNSVLGTTGITTNGDLYNGTCYDYAGNPTTTNCNSTYLTYTAKEDLYNSNGEDNIWGKLYLWSNLTSACKNPTGGNFSNTTQSTADCPCPTGWHVPSEQEFLNMEIALTCTDSSVDLNQRCSGLGWSGKSGKTDQNNIVKALNLPLAGRRNGGTFNNRSNSTHLWSSTEYDSSSARGRNLNRNSSAVNRFYRNKSAFGFSVRCIKD